MKPFKLLLFIFLLFGSNIQLFQAQTFGNGNLGTYNVIGSNNIINNYYAINSISGVTIGLNSAFPNFNTSRVLIIQMEGPTAGTWEWARVASSNGTSLNLTQLLTRTYSISNKVQLIIVPEYEYLYLGNNSSLTCPPYNPITGAGGVLAFNVKENFTIDQGSVCNVSGKGYPGGLNGIGGTAGTGGIAGLAGPTAGQNGGNNGTQPNTGLFRGGDGGSYGSGGTLGGVAGAITGLGSGSPSSNNSNLQVNPPVVLFGGAGAGGNGGAGKAGAGGGGGGAGAGAQNGTNGAAGTIGGNGGVGGNGGGIILFTAKELNVNSTAPVFIANGTTGTSATNGGNAGDGGNGGFGVNCTNLGGGGGGRGGDGGDGGNGGSGGAGGTIYGIISPSSSPLIAAYVDLDGGIGGAGGNGGANGSGGQNGGTISGPYPPPAPPANLGICSLEETLLILEQMGINGTNNASYTFVNNVHRWQTTSGNYFVEMIEVYPGLNLGIWRINGVGINGAFFAIIEGDPNFNLFQALDNLVNLNNVVSYTSTANEQIGEIFNGNEVFTSQCSYIRLNPSDGSLGINGTSGPAGNPGQFGFGTPDCDPSNMNFTITPGNNSILFEFPDLTFEGSVIIDADASPVITTDVLDIPITIYMSTVTIEGQLSDNCGNLISILETIELNPACNINFSHINIQEPTTCSDPITTVLVTATIDPIIYFQGFMDFSWDDNGTNSSQTDDGISTYEIIRDLEPGTYTISVTDYQFCAASYTFTINPFPNQLSIIDFNITEATCNQQNGEVMVSVVGGTEPYEYSINNIDYFTTNTFSNLNPIVNYTMYIRDFNGCEIQAPFQFQQGTGGFDLTTSLTQPTCSNPTGSILATATNGSAPYTFTINGGNSSTTGLFTGLNPGSYVIQATDASGCSTQSNSLQIIPVPSSNLTLSTNVTQATCASSTGSITATTSGGIAPYIYSLNGQNPSTNSTFTNLAAGNYTVSVADASGCTTSSGLITINPIATDLAVSFTTNQPLCSTNLGSIVSNVTGGTVPYFYTINGQASTNSTFADLNAGTYTIEISDANGCELVEQVSINSPQSLTATATLTQAICPGDGATIAIQVSGGTAPYFYDFGQGQISSNTFLANPGTYNVVVSDANNCITQISNLVLNDWITFDVQLSTTMDYCSSSNGTATVTVNSPAGISTIMYADGNQSFFRENMAAGYYEAIITSQDNCTYHIDINIESDKYAIEASPTVTDVSCLNGNDGAIGLTFLNGIAPYTVDWGFTTGTQISNLSAGTYTAAITDGNGCVNVIQVNVANPNPLTLSASVTNETCFGACDGSISLNPTNFNLASLNWSPSSNPTSPIQTGLCAGNYSVTATSDLGCTVTENYSLIAPDKLSINLLSAGNNLCFGYESGYIKVQATGGVAPYTYSWNTGATTDNIFNLPNGTYIVTVTDANGCTNSYQHIISSPSQLNLSITGNLSYCAGSSASITVNTTGGVAPYTGNLAPYTGSGTYNLYAGQTLISVKDANGCKVEETISISELPIPKFEISSTPSCKEQSNGTATLTELNAVHPVTYLWSNGQTTQNISNLPAGNYTVTVTDANGCTNNYTTTVGISQAPTLSAAITNAGCAPSTNGAIVLTVNQIANNPNMTYVWNTSATTSQLSNIGAGNYSVVVTDGNGCSVQSSFPIINDCPCPLNFNVDVCGPTVVCQGENFTLSTNIFPRPHGYPYTYTWTTPQNTTVNSANLTVNGAVASGTYTLTVTLPPNCTYTTQVYVTVRPRPIATISNAVTGTVDNYIHLRGCDIDLTATGGVYYNWFITSSPVLNNHTNQLTQSTNASTASTIYFKVTAIDSFGCASQQVQHRVRVSNPSITRSLNISGSNPTINRTLTMNQNTLFAGATYTWSSNGWNPGSSSSALRQRSGTISQLAGVYTLVINQNGCERTFQFEVLFSGKITPTIEVGTNKMNFNEENETIETEDLFQIKAFPNPVNDLLQFEFENPNNEDIGLIIMDNNGRILSDLNVGTDQRKVTIDVSSFATGMYFVQCTRDSIIHREKIKIIKE